MINNYRDFNEDFSENKNNIGLILIFVLILSLAIIAAVKIIYPSDKDSASTDTEIANTTILFQSKNIPTLRLGHYALWAVDEAGVYNFVKRFNSINNQLVSLNGEKLETLETILPDKFNKFVITIEKEGDRDETANNIEFMTAEYANNKSELLFEFANQHSNSVGSYILSTPTDGNSKINEVSGIWFTNKLKNKPSLNLSDIENNSFRWEARIIIDEITLEVGRFSKVNESDDFNSYSETEVTGYNFPGEDYLLNLPLTLPGPLNLANGKTKIIISLEPNANGVDPTGELIFIELLSATIPLNSAANTELKLNNSYESPSITITTK